MSDVNEIIKERLADYMREFGYKVERVLSWEDVTLSDGYCETCYYEYAGVKVEFIDGGGSRQTWEYNDSFASLVKYL